MWVKQACRLSVTPQAARVLLTKRPFPDVVAAFRTGHHTARVGQDRKMSVEVRSGVEASRLPVRGIAWGVAAVLAWALYNVGAKLGVAQGFQSQDLTLMRYGVAGLLMLPLILRSGLGSLGWRRGLMLT